MTRPAALLAVLVTLGAGWGITQPLAKIAVSEGYRHFGIILWQQTITALALGILLILRRRRPPLGRAQVGMFLLIAVIGTVIPNATSYQAAVHLPAGVLSILLSLVPLFAFPVALALGTDRFTAARLAGLLLGALGVAALVAPEASLPDPAMAAFIPLALVAPLFYGIEGNVIARWGTAGLDPVELLFGASVVGAFLSLPLALATGSFIDPRPPWGAPDLAILLSSLVHSVVYATYFWLVGRAGSVFAAQVAYLVTGFGVIWAKLLLGETYSGWIWLSLGLILAGLFLVQPRPKAVLVPADATGKDAR
jgi:drug/metabolite transporter (DMT)-like permease